MRQIRLLLLMSIAACAHRRSDPFGELQMLTPVSLPGDSIVVVRLRRQHPCETRVPRMSHFSDDIAASKLCTLVETAVATIRDLKAAADVLPDLREFRIERVLCATVRESAFRNDVTGEIALADWTLEFHSDQQPGVVVGISRLTGEARAYKEHNEFGYSAEDLCE